MSVRSTRSRKNWETIDNLRVEFDEPPECFEQPTRTRRKLRKTEDLVNFNLSIGGNEKSPNTEKMKKRLDTEHLPYIDDIAEEVVVKKRKIVKARRLLRQNAIEANTIDLEQEQKEEPVALKVKKNKSKKHCRKAKITEKCSFEEIIINNESPQLSLQINYNEGVETDFDGMQTRSSTKKSGKKILKVNTEDCHGNQQTTEASHQEETNEDYNLMYKPKQKLSEARALNCSNDTEDFVLPLYDDSTKRKSDLKSDENQISSTTDEVKTPRSRRRWSSSEPLDWNKSLLSLTPVVNNHVETKDLSPSLNNAPNSTELPSISPSTSGVINPTRRRTFELETSVTEISLLKKLSEEGPRRSSKGSRSMSSGNSLSENKSLVYMPATASKITLRRKPAIMSRDSPLSSTPKYLKINDSLLKNVLTKEKKFVSSVKIPDFKAIHQKAYDKMENLSEYKKRREERAKKLLSGQKPSTVDKPSKGASKKKLTFAKDTVEREKPFNYIPLPTTPMPRRVIAREENSVTPDNTKENANPGNKPGSSKQRPRSIVTPRKVEKFGLNRYGFNIGAHFEIKKEENKTLKNKDIVKNMIVNKTRPGKNLLEKKRDIIKGVRSNRRFDLLMKMRENKL